MLLSCRLLCYNTFRSGSISVTNNAFSFSKNHPFLMMVMNHVKQAYDPSCWGCIGPTLFTKIAIEMTDTDRVENIANNSSINFIPFKEIMSSNYQSAKANLFPEKPKSFEDWKIFFQNSSSVHFFSKITSELGVSDDPQYSAYALLGPRYCPLSFYSVTHF